MFLPALCSVSSSLLVQVWPSASTRGIPVLTTLYKKATLPSLLPPLILIYFYEMPLELFSILYLFVDQLSGLTHKNISCVRAGTFLLWYPSTQLNAWQRVGEQSTSVEWMNACAHIHTHEGTLKRKPTSSTREDPRFYLAMPLKAAFSVSVPNTLPADLDITTDAGKE